MWITSFSGKSLSSIVVAGIIATAGAAGTVRAAEMDVNIGFYPGATFHLPLYIADAKGFYKQAGLNPTLIAVANGPLMNSQMGSGAVDFGDQHPGHRHVADQEHLV